MSSIFQMSRDELASLLVFLRPYFEDKLIMVANYDISYLRMLITEWLLLNGLSTLHKFERQKVTETIEGNECSASTTPIEGKWQMPNKTDCSSCGKYRVGKPLEIYATLPQRHNVMLDQPTPQNNFGTESFRYMSSTQPIIKTKHGNLQHVHYSLQCDNDPENGISINGKNGLMRKTTFETRNHQQGDNMQSQRHSRNIYYNNNNNEEKCTDLCLICLFCECAPPKSHVDSKKRKVEIRKFEYY